MAVPPLVESVHPAAFIVAEAEGRLSRDSGIVPQNQTLVAGQVLGATADLTKVTAAAAQAAGNVGDGAITLDATAPVRGDAQDGVYTVEFITAGATAEFNLLSPAGGLVGTGAVGTLFNGALKFTIADDAARHYAPGDRILITVALPVTAIQYEALNLAATDGSQVASAIAIYPAATTAGQTAKLAVVARHAEVRGTDLTWPVGMTLAQIAEATVQLAARRIILR